MSLSFKFVYFVHLLYLAMENKLSEIQVDVIHFYTCFSVPSLNGQPFTNCFDLSFFIFLRD